MKQFLKGDTPKKKLIFFKDYYLAPTLVIIGIIALAIYYIYATIINQKYAVASIMILDPTDMATETMKADIESRIELEKDEEVEITQLSTASDNAYAAKITLLARLAAGDMDIMIGSEEDLAGYAATGYFEDLKTALPEELYKEVEPYLVQGAIVEYDNEGNIISTGEPFDYGIRLKEISPFMQMGTILEDPILVIVAAPDDLDEELEIVKYFIGK